MQVRAIRDCFVGCYRKAGEVFDHNGPKNRHLEPVKTPKQNVDEKDGEDAK